MAAEVRVPELLAPAGSRESALAALHAGADALYAGAGLFGARSSASFGDEDLAWLLHTAHLQGRRVYITVNTCLKEAELPLLRGLLQKLADLRADAVLVQDMGVFRILREAFPALRIHCSTQMALHSPEGVRLLRTWGASRVVLARECSLETVRLCAAEGMETEVFIHGAQCVCVSGQCRFSGLVGGRSGNRGRCAQPCRMTYRLGESQEALLSPRDLCLYPHLPKLIRAGVDSLKIEGRLKRPEYTYVVTRAYRNALDALAGGRALPPEEGQNLNRVFNRTFTPGYALGAQDAAVMRTARSGSEGLPLGRVLSAGLWQGVPTARVALERPLHNGDGIALRGSAPQDIIYSGPDQPAGAAVTLRLHTRCKAGDTAVLIDDENLLAQARAAFRQPLPALPCTLRLTARTGEPCVLQAAARGESVQAAGPEVQFAISAPLTQEQAVRMLSKTGETPFRPQRIDCETENAFLPVSALNALRREALRQLEDRLRDAWHPLPAPPAPTPAACSPAFPLRTGLAVRVRTPEAARAVDSLADMLIVAPANMTLPALERTLPQLPAGALVALPPQTGPGECEALLRALQAGGHSPVLGSLGQLGAVPPQSEGGLMLSEGVPVWNTAAARQLAAMGAGCVTLPWELTCAEAAALSALLPSAAPGLACLLPVYGRPVLMTLNHCPERVRRGLDQHREACHLCAFDGPDAPRFLTDTRGERYPLLPRRIRGGCLTELLASRALCLARDLPDSCLWLVDCTLETPEEARRIAAAYRALRSGDASAFSLPERRLWADRGVL